MAYGAEGALFGGGNAVSDYALGDPELNGQKVLSYVGMGAGLGAGLGALSKAVGLGRALTKGNVEVEAASDLTNAAEPIIEPPTGKVPKNLQEMNDAVENLKKYGGQEELNELPEKPAAMEMAQALNPKMTLPFNETQLDSLNSQASRNKFKTWLDVPGETGDILRNYQGAQKKELLGMLDNTIKDIAPGYEPTINAQEAGERASDALTNVIEGTRNELRPAFEQIKTTPIAQTDHLPGVIDYLTDTSASPYANPKIANMFETGGENIEVAPYKTSMGIDKSTYNAVKQAVESLKRKS